MRESILLRFTPFEGDIKTTFLERGFLPSLALFGAAVMNYLHK